jgi:hypothetical protein
MTIFFLSLIGALCALILFSLFMLARNEAGYTVRMAFINDDSLYPHVYQRLPSYSEMVHHPKHYLRWTKRQWMKYVQDEKINQEVTNAQR